MIRNKKGMGTVEIVIIIAVLVCLALLFREGLTRFDGEIMDFCFDEGRVLGSFG